jgi:Sulfatase-modifying factor enzyme 1
MLEGSKWEEMLKMAAQLAAAAPDAHPPAALIRQLMALNAPFAGRVALPILAELECDPVAHALRQELCRLSTENLDLRLRIEAGLALGELGDLIRYENCIGPHGAYRVPTTDNWVPIDISRSKACQPFLMAFAPVTNAEYRLFAESGGYDRQNSAMEAYWGSGDSLKWFHENARHPPHRPFWSRWYGTGAAQPVNHVTLWEAQAYCRWLNAQVADPAHCFRLPTAIEWLIAARGNSNSPYPWGDEPPTPEHGNFDETMLNVPSPVGVFPKGDRLIGNKRLTDLRGNVSEWASPWKPEELTVQAQDRKVDWWLKGGAYHLLSHWESLDSMSNLNFSKGGFRIINVPI